MVVFFSVVVCHSRWHTGSIMSEKQDDIQAAEQRVRAVTNSFTIARECLVQIDNATKLIYFISPRYTLFS